MSIITKILESAIIRSDKDNNFTGGLAQNAIEEENLTGLPSSYGTVESISIASDQNLDWDLEFWATDAFSSTDPDLEILLGVVKFVAADATQEAATGLYRYSTVNCSYPFRAFPYFDKDQTKELHVTLVNRSATGKNAGATGEFVLTVMFRQDGTSI